MYARHSPFPPQRRSRGTENLVGGYRPGATAASYFCPGSLFSFPSCLPSSCCFSSSLLFLVDRLIGEPFSFSKLFVARLSTLWKTDVCFSSSRLGSSGSSESHAFLSCDSKDVRVIPRAVLKWDRQLLVLLPWKGFERSCHTPQQQTTKKPMHIAKQSCWGAGVLENRELWTWVLG